MHKHYCARIGVAAALVAALTGPLPAHAAGGVRLVMNQLSKKCLIPASGPDYRVAQAACDRSDRRQLWHFDGEHEDQQIVNTATGRCLTVFSSADEQPVHAAACGLIGAYNHWTWVWTDEDYVFELEPLDARGHCLALRPGDAIMLRTCNGSGDRSRYWAFELQT